MAYQTYPHIYDFNHSCAVLDFGASGDGVTDNVKSFQNSLDAASAGGIGKTL